MGCFLSTPPLSTAENDSQSIFTHMVFSSLSQFCPFLFVFKSYLAFSIPELVNRRQISLIKAVERVSYFSKGN